MKRWSQVLKVLLIVVLLVASQSLSACFGPGISGGLTLKQPTTSPPTIGKAGSLRVGIDTSNAPFSYTSEGKIYGIDIDIAAAIAEEMGLKLEIVETRGQDVNVMLKDGIIDLVMGLHGERAASFSEVRVGPYLQDGPAIFTVGVSSYPPVFNPETLKGSKIVAQQASQSAWYVTKEYGEANIVLFPSLNQVFEELSRGAYAYAAADAIVGSFLAVGTENIRCVGILGESAGVYIGVASAKSELVNELTKTLRTLRDNGILEVIASKNLGPVSAQVVLIDKAIDSTPGTNPTTNGASISGGVRAVR